MVDLFHSKKIYMSINGIDSQVRGSIVSEIIDSQEQCVFPVIPRGRQTREEVGESPSQRTTEHPIPLLASGK